MVSNNKIKKLERSKKVKKIYTPLILFMKPDATDEEIEEKAIERLMETEDLSREKAEECLEYVQVNVIYGADGDDI